MQAASASQQGSTDGTPASSIPGLKGWATEHDLSSSRQPVIMSGGQATRTMPLSAAKSSPSLHQDDSHGPNSTPRGYNPSPRPLKVMTKSSTDILETMHSDSVMSPTSPKSPSYRGLPNRGVFDFSTSTTRRSPRNSYAGGSPRNSYASGSPRNSYASGSPRNSYAGYASSYSPFSSMSGFSPMSVPNSASNYQPMDTSRSGVNSSYNQKFTGANTSSYDDTPTHSTQSKSHDRRSLPPQALYQFRQEFQRESVKSESQKHLSSMPVTQEEDADREMRSIKHQPPSDLDLRPMYSPPAPPVRDISSLKYVKYHQNHEKYPSWPVTTSQPPPNLGAGLDTQGEKGKESESGSEKSEKAVYSKDRNRNSPNTDRKGSEDSKQRNQSDPGFKKMKNSFYTTRKPIEPDTENQKPEGERFDEFCKTSKPGYPPPKLDPDGNNYGDEKYNIPSPPERDMSGLDEKSLVEKIAAVISPHSQHHHGYPHTFHITSEAGYRSHRSDTATSPLQSAAPKIPGMYFQQAMNAQNLLRTSTSQNKNMVDSGTSPLNSPNEDRGRFFKTLHSNPKAESVVSPENKPRAIVITQRPYYNTSTQTEESLGTDSGHQGLNSLCSVSSSTTVKSDSSQSSGISSMTFSDQSSAGMMRKLSEEFYRGKLSGLHLSEKRLSSASNYDHDLKSPRSEATYGVLKEAESCNSVVIHAHESAGPFGRDDMGSSPSLSGSRHDTGSETDTHAEPRHKHRYSMDPNLMKSSGSSSLQPRNLQDNRFTSESNLSRGVLNQRNSHSQSLLQLNRPSSSLGETTPRNMSQSSQSSSASSRPRGSMEARSSTSRVSSSSSTAGDQHSDKQRTESDSVFYDGKSSPAPKDEMKGDRLGELRSIEVKARSGSLGRTESMKMAYGTFDENEHHYATPYAHQRNNSELLSQSARDPGIVHGRSMSFNDYMPMQGVSGDLRLGQIQEEGSEVRWQEAVRKSRSLSRDAPSNYENINIHKNSTASLTRETESEKKDSAKKGTSMRRTVSDNIKPKKYRQRDKQSDSGSGGYATSSGESSKGNKSDSENMSKTMSQHHSDTDLKKVQHEAVLDFVKRKRKSDSSEPQSPQVKDTAPDFPPPPVPLSPITVISQSPQSPLSDITKRYNYTQAQRNESLRRTQSITSNSSKDSDYSEMRRQNYQTEWSRLRSQDSKHPRRPLSIDSDIGGPEGRQTPLILTPETEIAHKRSVSETLPKHVSQCVVIIDLQGTKIEHNIILNF